MSSIIQQPAALSFTGNMLPVIVTSSAAVAFTLKKGEDTLIEQVFMPGDDSRVEVDLSKVIASALIYTVNESAASYNNTTIYGTFTVTVDATSFSFVAIRGGVRRLATSVSSFVAENFLTWQPQDKKVRLNSPEYLTAYLLTTQRVKLKATFPNLTTTTITLATGVAGAWTFNLTYAKVTALLSGVYPAFYDVWIETTATSVRTSYIQRYTYSESKSAHEHWFLFQNSLGGLDTLLATGVHSFVGDNDYTIGENNETLSEVAVTAERLYTKNTGPLDTNERQWLLDFFPSAGKYLCDGSALLPIVMTESDVNYSAIDLPSAYQFTYRLADDKPLLNLPRVANLPAGLSIVIPSGESFLIPPRLSELPRLEVGEGVMLPALGAYADQYGMVTVGALLSWLSAQLGTSSTATGGGVGHAHANFDLLQLLTTLDGYLKINGTKVKAGTADDFTDGGAGETKYSRKDIEDIFAKLMKFTEGLEIGDYTSDTGGCLKMVNGKSVLNVDQLTARERAIFRELLIEKQTHIGGESVVSPARMYCNKVEDQGTYFRCYFDRGDNEEVHNEFVVDDQARCRVLNGSTLKYYWRLVTGIGVDYIDLLYADCDAGSDYPEAGDMICQLGNRTIIERQNAQIFSSFGADSPSFKQYFGICDYSPLSTREETILSPSGNKLTGQVDMTAGSKGWENLDIAVGGVNLLRNTGLTGDYQPADLTEETELEEATPLFSNPLKYWNGTATVIEESAAVSGFAAVLSASSLYQSLASLIVAEHYVISFHAKGTSITASLAGFSQTVALTANYEKYYLRMVAGAGLEFMLTGTATIYDIQLERGTIATGWTKSPLDNDKSYSEIELLKFMTSAIKDGRTSVNGGLILSSMIMLGNFKDGEIQKVTSGINGIYNDDDDVAFFAGGTLEDAIAAVAEPSSMTTTKFVVTHGGKIITNEGYFRGAFACANGKIMLNADGSGHLAARNLMWDILGNIYGNGTFSAGDEDGRIVLDPSKKSVVLYNSNNTIIGAFGFLQTEGNWDYSQAIMELYEYSGETITGKTRVSPSSIVMTQGEKTLFKVRRAPSDQDDFTVVTLNLTNDPDNVEVGDSYHTADGIMRVKMNP